MPRETRHGAAHSNVGSRALYEGQDQINDPQSVINERKRYGGGRASGMDRRSKFILGLCYLAN